MVDSKNRVIPHNKVFYSLDKGGLPTYDDLMEKGEKLKKELSDIVNSPIQKNDVYPVIIDPSNHGVLWHEVVGHALEGHRMQHLMKLVMYGVCRLSLFLLSGRMRAKLFMN